MTRVSEKTVEINCCADASAYVAPNYKLTWRGLTQKQEKLEGYDASFGFGGSKLFYLQFKASNKISYEAKLPCNLKTRSFHAQTHQMEKLIDLARINPRGTVFYVLPNFGVECEFVKLNKIGDIIDNCLVFDVKELIPYEANIKGSKSHTIKLTTCDCGHISLEIHSEPIFIENVSTLKQLFEKRDLYSESSEHIIQNILDSNSQFGLREPNFGTLEILQSLKNFRGFYELQSTPAG